VGAYLVSVLLALFVENTLTDLCILFLVAPLLYLCPGFALDEPSLLRI
jgi:hypothetical protein